MLKERWRGRATRARTMIIINVVYSLRPSSLTLSFSPSPLLLHSRAVRALPAVPLICRFVCAFKHESPRRGTEQREATNEKRRSEERTPRQGGNKTGKGCRGREGEKGGNNGGEKQRERDGFAIRGGEKWLECPGKISSKRTKGKVRLSSLRTSPPTFQFPFQKPGISLCVPFSFLFCDYTVHLLSSLVTLCRSFVRNCRYPQIRFLDDNSSRLMLFNGFNGEGTRFRTRAL